MGNCNTKYFQEKKNNIEKKEIENENDMAILLVIFNPLCSKRIIMNYWYTRKIYETEKRPVFTLELVYGERCPEIPDALHVKAESLMFHKENLYRIFEKSIDKKYTKLAFLDSDILFSSPYWYEKTSKLLNDYDVVQPFSICNWLDLTYTNVLLTRNSIASMKEYSATYHPGFAWCMRRDWYNKVGFFDFAFSGSGDTLSAIGWLKHPYENFPSLPKALKNKFIEFWNKESPRLTHTEGIIVNHLYHGSRKNRQYLDRHSLLNIDNNISEMIFKNKYGVYEWKKQYNYLDDKFFKYFSSRNDDDLSDLI